MDKGQKNSVHGANVQTLASGQKVKYPKSKQMKRINILNLWEALKIQRQKLSITTFENKLRSVLYAVKSSLYTTTQYLNSSELQRASLWYKKKKKSKGKWAFHQNSYQNPIWWGCTAWDDRRDGEWCWHHPRSSWRTGHSRSILGTCICDPENFLSCRSHSLPLQK